MPGGDGTGPMGGGGPGTGRGMRTGGGRGRNNGPLSGGPGGVCICPKCKTTTTHRTGQSCVEIKCPECGTQMTRG